MRVLNELLLDTTTTIAASQNSIVQDLTHIAVWDITAVVAGANAANKTFVGANVNITSNLVTITAHGFATGEKVTLTTSNTLPAGLALLTDYYLVAPDADTIGFATSQANALAGTKIDITDIGLGTQTVVVTTALAGSIKLQKTNDPATVASPTWFDITSSSQSFAAAAVLNWTGADVGYRALRAVVTVTSGEVTAAIRINAKGM